MKARNIMMILVALMAVLPVYAKKNGKEPSVKFAETKHNFGTIREEAGSVTHEFEFYNEGTGNLVVMDATAQCGCTRPEYPKNPVAPGKRGVIRVTYNPAGRPGSFEKVVTVRTNGKPSKSRLKITGTVIPKK